LATVLHPPTVKSDPAARTPRLRPRANADLRRPRLRWALIAPAMVLLLAMTVFPFLYALWISAHKWKTTFPVKPFIGLDNYSRLVTDDDRFTNAIVQTVLIGVAALTIEFVFGPGHGVALLARLPPRPLAGHADPAADDDRPVVVGFTARMAFTDNYGFVNQILSLVTPGEVSPQWLSDSTLAPLVIIAADAWQWGPFVFLLLLAGLLATTGDEVEAAVVDGANGRQVFWHVLLPGMRYILIVALVLRGLDLLRMFDVVALATRGGPGVGTETLTYYIYNLGFKFFDLGYAAAASMLMLVGVSVLVTFAVRSVVRGARA
jgi:multiple sugar transport system permease protein